MYYQLWVMDIYLCEPADIHFTCLLGLCVNQIRVTKGLTRNLLCTFTYSVLSICPTHAHPACKQIILHLTLYKSYLNGNNLGASWNLSIENKGFKIDVWNYFPNSMLNLSNIHWCTAQQQCSMIFIRHIAQSWPFGM